MDFMQILLGTIGILAFMLIPGIALSLAFFPRKQDLGTVERMGLSLLFGLTPFVLQYFLDKNLSIPITTSNTYLILGALTGLGLLVWVIRLKFAGKWSAPKGAQSGA